MKISLFSKLRSTVGICILALTPSIFLANTVHAVEPNASSSAEKSVDEASRQTQYLQEIIVKYTDEKSVAETDKSGEMKARDLSELARESVSNKSFNNLDFVGLNYIGKMSGNAEVFSVEGISGLSTKDTRDTLQSIADRISELPDVEYAEPNILNFIQQVNDSRFPEQWHYRDSTAGINVLPAWKISTGENVRVAVIDTGSRPHADLVANLLPGFDFISDTRIANDGNGIDNDATDPGDWISNSDFWCSVGPRNSSWHGTHVSGTIAAVTDNKLGVAGVSYKAKIIPIRVLGKCGGSLRDIANGIRWAAGLNVPGAPDNQNPAHVINMSLGGRSDSCPQTYQRAINDAVAAGTTVVVAAGNSDRDVSGFTPANCDNVITVASTNNIGDKAWYSNFGIDVDVAAPGGETRPDDRGGVLSTSNSGRTVPLNDSYRFQQGTSMAAPHVAGIAALLYSKNESITPKEVEERLKITAKPFPSGGARPCTTTICGSGIVDAAKAFSADSLVANIATSVSAAELLRPVEIENGWTGIDSNGDRYQTFKEDDTRELWFEGNEGTGEISESFETDEQFLKLSSLPSLSPWDGAIGPQRIIGSDDRKRVLNTTRYPESAQVLVALPRGRCSGALIGRDLVITAGHCVHSGGASGNWQTSAVIYPGRNGRQAPFGSCNATRFYSVLGWTRDKNPAYDFGAIKLDCDIGNRAGWLGFFWQSASLVGKSAIISSYPIDKPLEQWAHADKVHSNSSLQTRYQTDTVRGNSGSGVFAVAGVPQGCGGPCVHTAHAYGGNSFNSGTRITKPLFQNLIDWLNAPK